MPPIEAAANRVTARVPRVGTRGARVYAAGRREWRIQANVDGLARGDTLGVLSIMTIAHCDGGLRVAAASA